MPPQPEAASIWRYRLREESQSLHLGASARLQPREKSTKNKGLQRVPKSRCFVLAEGAGAFSPGFLFRRHNRTFSATSSAPAFASTASDPRYPHKFVIPTAAQRSGGICCLPKRCNPTTRRNTATATAFPFERYVDAMVAFMPRSAESNAGKRLRSQATGGVTGRAL
jgi:hypothetical protein